MCNIKISTLGCRLNQIESESLAKYFLDAGFNVDMLSITTQTPHDCDTYLCILNTCAVTQKAEQKARRIIRLLLKTYANATILITGCYAQLSSSQICKIDSRICVLGGQIKSRIKMIPDLLKQKITNGWNPIDFVKIVNENLLYLQENKNYPEKSFDLSTTSFLTHSRSSLKIQDGCNNNCSYCTIHIARGKSVSIPPELAIKRVQELENQNQAEVVLTTVNIAQYKAEYDGQTINFAKLLKLLLQNTTKIHFRISSLYPEIVDNEFCSVVSNDRVCPHFHISVQSGSNKILKLMNRSYVAQDVETACRKLRECKKNPFIACDIITGFPEETEHDFLETVDLCKKCNFSWIHAFPFSERPGTMAVTLNNKVPQSISGERAKILNELAVNNKLNYISSYLNKNLTAVLEVKKNNSMVVNSNSQFEYHATTNNFIHCILTNIHTYPNSKLVNIQITKLLTNKIKKGGELEAEAILLE